MPDRNRTALDPAPLPPDLPSEIDQLVRHLRCDHGLPVRSLNTASHDSLVTAHNDDHVDAYNGDVALPIPHDHS